MLEKISRAQLLAVMIIGVFLVFGVFKYYTLRIAPPKELEVVEQPEVQQASVPKLLTIHVVGAVVKPGVYTLAEGQRINDAVTMAEPTGKADLSLINLAAPLQDGRQIYVPTKGEKAGSRAAVSTGSTQQERGKININHASASELDRLNGIGPALAQRIIDYRENQGPFTTIEEITKVNGIGTALLAKIKDDIIVD